MLENLIQLKLALVQQNLDSQITYFKGLEMKETQWLHIDKKFEISEERFSKYYDYSTVDEFIGEVNAYKINPSLIDYKDLIDLINQKGIRHTIFRREFSFTKKEKDNAEILNLNINPSAQESYSPDHEGIVCEHCKERVQFAQINNLHVKYKTIKKFDLSITYNGDTEIIVSEKLKDLFIHEAVTGVRFSHVYELNSNDVIEGFYHLRLDEGIGEVVEPPTIVEKDVKCIKCGFYHTFLCQTPYYFNKETWNGNDIFFTSDWFGSPPQYQGKSVIISQRLFKILKEYKIISYTDVEPSYLL